MLLAKHVQNTIALKKQDMEPRKILATLLEHYHEEKVERPKSTFEHGKSTVKTLFNGNVNRASIQCAEFYANSLTEEKDFSSGNLFDPVNRFFPDGQFNDAPDSFVRVLQGFIVFHPETFGLLHENIQKRIGVMVPWQPFDKPTLITWIKDLINGLPQNQVISARIGGGNDREMRENSAYMLGMLRSFLLPEHYQEVFDALKSRVTRSSMWGTKDSQPAVREAAMSTLVTLSPLFSDDLREQLPKIFFENLKSEDQRNREAAGRVFVQYIYLYPEGQKPILEQMRVLFHEDKHPDVRRAAIKVMASICQKTSSSFIRTGAFEAVATGLWEKKDPEISHYTAQILQDDLSDTIPDNEKELLARKLSNRLFSDDLTIQIMATRALARMPAFFRQLPKAMILDDLDLFLSRLVHPIKEDPVSEKYVHPADIGEFKENREDAKEEQNHIEKKQPHIYLEDLLNTAVNSELQDATLDALKNLADIFLSLADDRQQKIWMMGLLSACHHPDKRSIALQALLACPDLLKIRETDLHKELQKNIAGTMTALIEIADKKEDMAAAVVIGHLFSESGPYLQDTILGELIRLRKESANTESRKAAILALMYIYPAEKGLFQSRLLTEILATLTEDGDAVKEAVLDAMPALISESIEKDNKRILLKKLEALMMDGGFSWRLRTRIAVCLLGRVDDVAIAPPLLQEAMTVLTEALESELAAEEKAHILNGIKALRKLPWREAMPENETPKGKLFKAFVSQLENPEAESVVIDGIRDWIEAGEEGIQAAVFGFLAKKLCMDSKPRERVLFAKMLSTTLELISEQQINQNFFRLFDKVARHWLGKATGIAGTGLEVMGLVCAKHATTLLAKPMLDHEAVLQERCQIRAVV